MAMITVKMTNAEYEAYLLYLKMCGKGFRQIPEKLRANLIFNCKYIFT